MILTEKTLADVPKCSEHAGRLDAAARLIRSVASDLNDKGHACPECGLNVKEAFIEAKTKEQLEAMAARLDGLARDFRR